jgi:archaellum component FlaC
MIADDALAKSLDAAIEGSARKERRFWLLTVLWVLGSAVILWFLWSWSGRLDALSTQLEGVEQETVGLVESARKSQGDFEVLRTRVQESGEQVVAAQAALANTRSALEAEQDRFESFADTQRREQQQFRAAIAKLTTQYTQEIDRLNRETAAAQQRYQEVEKEFTTLRQTLDRTRAEWMSQLEEANRQVNTMRERVGNVERQLQVSHFVLQTRSRNLVYGMDLYVGFGAWNKSRLGLNDFCLSASKEGECFLSRDFVPLGEPIAVSYDGFSYTITPRYAVGMLLAHDHVGFDILRERIATP